MVDAGDMIGQPGQQRRHARDVAVVLTGLVGTAIDHIVDLVPVHRRMPFLEHTHRMRGEVVGADILQHTAIAADRRADEIADIGVGHGVLPGVAVSAGLGHRRVAGKIGPDSGGTARSACEAAEQARFHSRVEERRGVA